MKHSFKKSILALLVATIGIYSCKDSFLDTPPQAALSNTLLAGSKSGVNATLIASYHSLSGWIGAGGNAWGAAPSNWVYNLAADEVHKGSEAGDGDAWLAIELFQWNPGESSFSNKWLSCYEGINRANSSINTANDFLKANPSETTFVNRTIGEAIFLRAYFHFELYKVFKNAPYFTEADKDFNKPNDKPMIPLIIADLEKAISLLDADKVSAGRADKTIATAFLGKVKLYNKDYPGALIEFNKVIASGKYKLSDCIYDNFNLSTENNSENIFSVQASVNDGDAGGQNANNSERLGLPHGDSFTSCCGFKQPTHDLVYAFKVDANGLPMPTKGVALRRILAGDADVLDPRVEYTAGRTNVPYLDWGAHKDSWIRGQGYQGWYSPKRVVQLKANPTLAGGWTGTQLSALNFPLMRYADVLLMAAECEVESGSLEKARGYVNQIRKRAGNCTQGAGTNVKVAINAPEITWGKYAVSQYTAAWTNQATAREAVRTERRLELALEGHRVFDLQRWGVYAAVMADYVPRESKLVSILSQAQPVAAKHDAWPIPSVEILKSNGVLKQNSGY
ncbi:putative outer membrane starch-binding protein [Arcicella aurantiaca]|uniref:Putative outer membrane starch-binding protein n=1 Tax=Arcicella aurantiaca TaxID=591202 RepID=A0A316E3U3_9BACT|nr:RagB/SusD family nutrient uptake outer membrane protein [Arcicella aurantiaca]PWK23383.1 putative outer membrane starch-binding protein [Arcicella aurantiaca]